MGRFGIILRNVDLGKKDKEKIHEVIKHTQKIKKDENEKMDENGRQKNAKN